MVRVSLTPAQSEAISTSRNRIETTISTVNASSLHCAVCPNTMPSTAEYRVSTTSNWFFGPPRGASHEATGIG